MYVLSRHVLLLAFLSVVVMLTVLHHIFPSSTSSLLAYAQEDEEYYEDEEETGNQNANQAQTQQTSTSSSAEEDEYYDEYYEEEEVQQPSGRLTSEINMAGEGDEGSNVRGPEYNGFIRHPGGGLMKISHFLANEEYLNQTAEVYECIRRDEAFILMLEQTQDEKKDDFGVEELTNQVNSLRQKMEKAIRRNLEVSNPEAAAEATATEATKNATVEVNTTSTDADSSGARSKRVSFREKQAQKMKERREKIAQRELIRPKFRLGLDCESLVCGSCKTIIDEFGDAIHRSITDPKIRYIDQLFEGFCDSKYIKIKYDDIVYDICKNFEDEKLGYKEAVVAAFEEDGNWPKINTYKSLAPKKEKICVAIGACSSDQFEFQTEPLYEQQEHWDDKCFTCQAFAQELEQRTQVTRHVTEASIVPIVKSTCDRMVS